MCGFTRQKYLRGHKNHVVNYMPVPYLLLLPPITAGTITDITCLPLRPVYLSIYLSIYLYFLLSTLIYVPILTWILSLTFLRIDWINISLFTSELPLGIKRNGAIGRSWFGQGVQAGAFRCYLISPFDLENNNSSSFKYETLKRLKTVILTSSY